MCAVASPTNALCQSLSSISHSRVTVALGKPVALDAGQAFASREGGRTVGAGTVTALLD